MAKKSKNVKKVDVIKDDTRKGVDLITAELVDTGKLEKSGELFIYEPGAYEHQASQVAGECFGFEGTFDVTKHTDPEVNIILQLQVSQDGGATWEVAGQSTVPGGMLDKNGNPATVSVLGINYTRNGEIGGVPHYNIAPFVDPLVRTVVLVEGKSVAVKFDSVEAKPRTQPLKRSKNSIAIVQSVDAYAATAVSVTTGAITTTSTNLLVAFANNYPTSTPGLGSAPISDSETNVWLEKVPSFLSAGNQAIACFAVDSCVGGGSHTFTCTPTGGGYPSIVVVEVSGHASSTFDKEAHDITGAGTSHPTGSTAATVQARELLLAFGSGGSTFSETYTSAGGSWTTLINQSNSAGVRVGYIAEWQIVSATGTQSWAFTSSSAMASNQMITTWKEFVAGPSYTGNGKLINDSGGLIR